VTLKGETRDPTMLRAQYLKNGWIHRLRSKGLPIGNGSWASNGDMTDAVT